MATLRSVLAMGWLCLAALCGHAGEVEDRSAIAAEFVEAFDRSDFALIESRYAKALAAQKRLGSGAFVANRMVRYMFERKVQAGEAPAPGTKPSRGDDNYWLAVQEKTRGWGAQFPGSVLPALALSRAHEEHAWAHRGTGYSSTVTEEAWSQFAANVRLASHALASRADAGKKDPNWWYQMLMLAWVQSWPEERYWQLANAAMEAFPQNHDIYSAIARKLLPQWGGSWKAVAALADHAVQRTRKAQGESLYARIYWHVQSYLNPGLFTSGQADWPRIRAGFEDLIKRYPDPWNINSYARLACDAGDKDTAQRLFPRIRNSVVPSAWANHAAYSRCRDWAAS